MATFTFSLRTGNELESFSIEQSGEKRARSALVNPGGNPEKRKSAGCGASIKWTGMAPVSIPPELMEAKTVTTKDVLVVPREARNIKEEVTKKINEVKLTFGN